MAKGWHIGAASSFSVAAAINPSGDGACCRVGGFGWVADWWGTDILQHCDSLHSVTGGTKLATTTPAKEEAKADSAAPAAPVRDETQAAAAAALGEKEVEPVGQEYIEEIKNEEGQSNN